MKLLHSTLRIFFGTFHPDHFAIYDPARPHLLPSLVDQWATGPATTRRRQKH